MASRRLRPLQSVFKEDAFITKTPLRLSFLGGGTDFPEFFLNNGGGKVVSTAIDKYLYVTLKKHSDFFSEKIRLNYSEIELAKAPADLKNEIAKGVLEATKFSQRLYIGTIADFPAQSGLGSSSAFCVGLINGLYKAHGIDLGSSELASMANFVELEHLGRPMGHQDAYPCAFGGLNLINFNSDGSVSLSPILLSNENASKLNESIFLVYTGKQRSSGDVLAEQQQNTKDKTNVNSLLELRGLTDEFASMLNNAFSLAEIGRFLSENWKLKRKLSSNVSNVSLDELYSKIMASGAYGAKLAGAGGGGFFLCIVDKHKSKEFCAKLGHHNVVSVAMSSAGAGSV